MKSKPNESTNTVSSVILSKNESIIENDGSAKLLRIYMLFNQAMYAVSAIPCQLCLAIAPVFLLEQKDMSVEVTGYFMSAGSVFSVLGMKIAEKMENGFLFRRPKDLYFLVASMGIYLAMIPIWPADLWYLSGGLMALVLASSDTLMPVVAESVHRLSLMADKKPEKIFAQASMVRQYNGALIGLLAPLMYNALPSLCFYFFGGFCLVFLAIYCGVDHKIKSIYRYSTIRFGANRSVVVGMSMQSSQYFSSVSLSTIFGQDKSVLERISAQAEDSRVSVVGALQAFLKIVEEKIGEDDEEESEQPVSPILDALEEGKKTQSKRDISGKSVESTAHDSEFLGEESSLAADDEDKKSDKMIRVKALNLGKRESMELCKALSSAMLTSDEGCRPSILRSSSSRPSILRSSSSLMRMRMLSSSRFDCAEDSGRLSSHFSSSRTVRFNIAEDLSHSVLPELEEKAELSETEDEEAEEDSIDFWDKYAYFLVVYAFPFFDMGNIVFPFSFLSIAITNDMTKSFVIFGYNMGRGVSASIQVWKLNSLTPYILNGIPLIAFIAFVAYTNVSDGELWYIPLLFTSLSETMPSQQKYLIRLFKTLQREGEDDDLALRTAVKASHASTGFGSIYSFLVTSQVFARFGIVGVAYLGLGMATIKFLTILQIDFLYARKKKKMQVMAEEAKSNENQDVESTL